MPSTAEPKSAVTIRLSKAELAALDQYLDKNWSQLSREEGLARIFAQWATEQGLLPDPIDGDGLEPDELNASNDG
jgi:hypothetical protein